MIHISTDYVYDGSKEGYYQKTNEANPKNVYGASKHEGDLAVSKIDKHIILRVAWVFSSHGNNFVKTMLRIGKERSELKIVDDQTGCPTWSGDIAGVIIRLINDYKSNNELKWGVYHFIGQPSVSWFQFAETIFKESKQAGVISNPPHLSPIETKEYPTAAVRPQNSVLNCLKINKELGIIQPDWMHGLRQVLIELK